MDEKDRLGNKLRDVEKAREDQWAAERDRELIEKLRRKRAELQAAASEATEAMGLLCPHCHQPLVASREHGVDLLACPNQEGAWLDKKALGELLESKK